MRDQDRPAPCSTLGDLLSSIQRRGLRRTGTKAQCLTDTTDCLPGSPATPPYTHVHAHTHTRTLPVSAGTQEMAVSTKQASRNIGTSQRSISRLDLHFRRDTASPLSSTSQSETSGDPKDNLAPCGTLDGGVDKGGGETEFYQSICLAYSTCLIGRPGGA